MSLSLKIALRYVFFKSKESFSSYASILSIGGLSIGIAALMLTASILNGFEEIVSKKLSAFLGLGRITNIFGNSINIKNETFEILNTKLIDPEPFIQGLSLVRHGKLADGILIEGIERLPKSIIDFNHQKINQGEIIIGAGLSNSLDCKIGDIIYIQPFNYKVSNSIKKIFSFEIKHIFQSGIQEYDKLLGYININDARSLFNIKKDNVTGFILNDSRNIDFINEISYPFYFESWQDKHALLFEWIKVQRWPAYIMFGLIALVGLINVLAALSMIIIEKSSQIGILLSQGMNRNKIKFIFIFQGSIIGLMGALLGGLISLLIIIIQLKYQIFKIPTDIYFMDQIPFSFDYISFGIIVISIFIFCLIASWWPTKVVSAINPSKVLKYE